MRLRRPPASASLAELGAGAARFLAVSAWSRFSLEVPFGYAVANEVCRPWAVFQSHSFYGWETVALYSSGILRHLLSWRWGTPFTSYTYTSGFFRAGRPGVSRRPARWFFYSW